MRWLILTALVGLAVLAGVAWSQWGDWPPPAQPPDNTAVVQLLEQQNATLERILGVLERWEAERAATRLR
jgi:hypothetical protein